MPKIDQLQTGFTSGELSPLMYGAPDNPRYKKGLQTCLNYMPTLQGPLNRRPGTKFMNPVKDSANPPTLIPFTFSQTQAYMLEFGDHYIRFYAANGLTVCPTPVIQLNGGTPASQFAGPITPANGGMFPFYATRATNNPNPGEYINPAGQNTIGIGGILELQTPYAVADVPLIRYAQNADTLYLTHPKYPPYKLQRFGQTFWTIVMINIQDGPYLPLNSYKTIGDNLSTTLTAYNLIAGGPPNNFGVTTGPTLTITGAASSGGLIKITTSAAHGLTTGSNIFITSVVGTTEANCYDNITSNTTGPYFWTVTVLTPTTFTLNGSTFVNAWVSGGIARPPLFAAEFQAEQAGGGVSSFNPLSTNWNTLPDAFRRIALISGGLRYWGVIVNAFNASNITVFVPGIAFPIATATAWQLGKWSNALGYPGCTTFHQNRLCFAGALNYPQDVELSQSANYEAFPVSVAQGASALQVLADNAMSETLSSNDVNVIFWLKSTAQGLLAGTYSSEWMMTPDNQSGALTPANFNAQQTSFYGSAQADAQLIGNAVMYIQRAKRKIREMAFFFQVGTFRSNDMSELSEHITIPTVTQLAVQKESQPILWALRSDGALLSMVYNREDLGLSCGITRHFLGGQSDSGGATPVVTSIAIIPDPTITFDQLWMIVKRYINGSTIYMIEYMTNIFNEGILQEDAFQLDCGATFYNPKTITGLTIASTAVVTSTAHGFSNGDQVKIVSVVGLNKTTTDVNGLTTISNLVNGKTFVVAGVTANTFQLNDFNGNPISSVGYSVYASGGQAAKLITTISGATWLQGETVGVLADGAIHPNVVVSGGGAITLGFPAAKVQLGYLYKSQGRLMRTEGGSANGTSFGKIRRTTRFAMQLNRVGDMSVGLNFIDLLPVEFQQADVQLADNATALYSGMIRDGLQSAYGFDSMLCFQQSSPLPGTIQSITSFIEEQDP